MTNEELIAKTSKARGLAHRAPFAEYSMDHKGHTAIVNHTNSWAMRGNNLMALAEECSRRGIPLPKCDCPPELHLWETKKKDKP